MSLADRLADLAAAESTTPQATPAPASWTPGVVWDGNAGTLTTEPLTAPPSDWTDLLRIWDLDPTTFEVVEPVQYRAWDAAISGGSVLRMSYYRAAIRRRRAGVDIDVIKDALLVTRAPP